MLELSNSWIIALAILAVSILAAAALRWLVGWIAARQAAHGSSQMSSMLRNLAPGISTLAAAFGIRLALQAAPFQGRALLWIDTAIHVFTVFVFLYIGWKAVVFALNWISNRSGNGSSYVLKQGFVPLFRNLITLFFVLMFTIMVLRRLNYDVMSLITALGVGSLAVGLAAKETLANMISGFTLIIDRNLMPGDRVNLGNYTGDVEEIGLRSTRIKIGNNTTLIVPNSELVNSKILNLSLPSRSHVCASQFRVSMDVPFSRVRETCLGILRAIDQVDHSHPATVLLSAVNEGVQLISVSFWVADMNHEGTAISEFNERLLETFRTEKIPVLGQFTSPRFITSSQDATR